MTVFPLADGRLIAITTSSGPSSYSSGGFSVTVSELRKVEQVIAVYADAGYLCTGSPGTGNAVTVKAYYFDYDASADGAAIEVADGTDLSGVTFTVVAIGF